MGVTGEVQCNRKTTEEQEEMKLELVQVFDNFYIHPFVKMS